MEIFVIDNSFCVFFFFLFLFSVWFSKAQGLNNILKKNLKRREKKVPEIWLCPR